MATIHPVEEDNNNKCHNSANQGQVHGDKICKVCNAAMLLSQQLTDRVGGANVLFVQNNSHCGAIYIMSCSSCQSKINTVCGR